MLDLSDRSYVNHNHMKVHTLPLVALVALVATALPARAVLVQEVAITPYKDVPISVTGFYTGNAAAGINKLLVDGVAKDGFCIDPFHFAVASSNGYQFTPLANAPKAPATMGAVKADQISRLWSMAYSASMTGSQAAAFQIAIWEIVGGSLFSISGSDYGAGALLSSLTAYTGPGANLVGLTGLGQDYVIEVVPESGATIALLSFAVGAILVAQRRLRIS